jgi:hypothetical protein
MMNAKFGIFETEEELDRALEKIGEEARQEGYDGRMSQEELLESGAVDETALHEGECTLIIRTVRE